MTTPLNVALDIGRVICKAQMEHTAVDVSACAAELFLRFIESGCSRGQIAEALEEEANAAGVTIH